MKPCKVICFTKYSDGLAYNLNYDSILKSGIDEYFYNIQKIDTADI